MQLPKRKSEQNRRHDNDDRYLTPKRIREMKDELERLEKRIRPKAVEDLTAAREMGDLSENAAYTHAKGRLAGIDRRMFELNDRIKNAIPIEAGGGPAGQVGIGATVTVEVSGRRRTFEITGSQETDPGSGRISYRSPVGAALMNRAAGERVSVRAADREVEYLIVSVE
ncbi:MAG: GreA/GreB family elongation factor [bacterium]